MRLIFEMKCGEAPVVMFLICLGPIDVAGLKGDYFRNLVGYVIEAGQLNPAKYELPVINTLQN